MNQKYKPETQVIRAGQIDRGTDAHAEPLVLTSSFRFKSAEQAAERFSGQVGGNIYSRFTNPTTNLLAQRLALLEGGDSAQLFATGMAAVSACFLSLLRPGDNLVASAELFGTTNSMLNQYTEAFGVEVRRVPLSDLDAWRGASDKRTKLYFLETPSNPQNRLVDLPLLAELAKENDTTLIVDNTTCTAALQTPLKLGADIVVLSLTKYIDGHGRVLGGAVVGQQALLDEKIYPHLRTFGASISPFNSWMILQGLQTLHLRMQQHCRNAQKLAEFLCTQKAVTQVHYLGLEGNAQHELALRQQKDFGALLSFELDGLRPEAFAWINRLKLISITANLGDTKTIVTHPATTTHHKLTAEQKLQCGIGENLIRIAAGLENIDDLLEDVAQAFLE